MQPGDLVAGHSHAVQAAAHRRVVEVRVASDQQLVVERDRPAVVERQRAEPGARHVDDGVTTGRQQLAADGARRRRRRVGMAVRADLGIDQWFTTRSLCRVGELAEKVVGIRWRQREVGLVGIDDAFDIKPQNLFISEFGEPALGDFGISTLDDERSISGGGGLTVHYAPAGGAGGFAGRRRLRRLLLRRHLVHVARGARPLAAPTGRQSVGELARRIMLEPPPRLSRPDVPRSLSDLLARTMSKEPAARPVSGAEFGQELRRIQGELGLPVTVLPIVGPVPVRPATPALGQVAPHAAPSPAVAGEVAPPWPGAPLAPPAVTDDPDTAAPPPQVRLRPIPNADQSSSDNLDDDHGRTITVGRSVPSPAAPAETIDTHGGGPSTRRVVLGTAAALVCLLIVAGALLIFGGGGDDTTPTTTDAGGNPSILATGPATPSGLSAIRTAEGGVLVAWQAPEDPASVGRYQVQRKDGDGGAGSVVETPDGETLSVTFPEIGATNAACFTVIAIGVDNALSDESRLVCA